MIQQGSFAFGAIYVLHPTNSLLSYKVKGIFVIKLFILLFKANISFQYLKSIKFMLIFYKNDRFFSYFT